MLRSWLCLAGGAWPGNSWYRQCWAGKAQALWESVKPRGVQLSRCGSTLYVLSYLLLHANAILFIVQFPRIHLEMHLRNVTGYSMNETGWIKLVITLAGHTGYTSAGHIAWLATIWLVRMLFQLGAYHKSICDIGSCGELMHWLRHMLFSCGKLLCSARSRLHA